MVFIQSNDRKWRYEFRAIQKTCKMRSVYKNQIRAKQENNDACKSVINTQQMPFLGWFSMSPLPRLHHHDIMTIVGLFTYCQYVIYMRTVRTSRNVGALKVADLHCSR